MRRSWRGRRCCVLVALAGLVGAACGGGDDGADGAAGTSTTVTSTSTTTATTASTTTTTVATTTTTTAEQAASIPASPVTAVLDQPYGDGQPAVAPGAVTVHWYRGDGSYVALYTGDGLAGLPPLCPGNSLASTADQSFAHVANAPTGEGGCDGVDSTIVEIRVCDGAWLFPTAIPEDAEGQLFASISSPGTTAGVLGSAATGADVPEIDAAAASYEVDAGVLAGGATELAC